MDPKNLVDILIEHGHQPVKLESRDQVLFRCPFHPDSNPSLSVNTVKNVWFCHPCREGGGRITLLAKLKGISVVEMRRLDREARYGGYDPEKNYSRQYDRWLEQWAKALVKWDINPSLCANWWEAHKAGYRLCLLGEDPIEELRKIKEIECIQEAIESRCPFYR